MCGIHEHYIANKKINKRQQLCHSIISCKIYLLYFFTNFYVFFMDEHVLLSVTIIYFNNECSEQFSQEWVCHLSVLLYFDKAILEK